MRLKMIACEVLSREIYLAAALGPHTVDVEFTKKDAHEESSVLRRQIQERIDAVPEGFYAAVLLGYGLCGNGTVGLKARHTPLVLPRAHDCCTLFLGSRQAFRRHFADNPSRPFSSLGYMERGETYFHQSELRKLLGLDRSYEEYACLYGEDNARYLWETLTTKLDLQYHQDKVVFIEMPQTAHLGWAERFGEQARSQGLEFEVLQGSSRLLQNLINGMWDPQEFLKVEPGCLVQGVYDWDEICRAERIGERA